MGKPVIKFFDKIIVILLGFLGVFNSCRTAVEYGEPYAEFEIKGLVSNKDNAEPIQNIRIIRNSYDTLYTNQEGKYVFNFSYDMAPYPENVYHLKIEDIDGEENGGDYKTQEIDVKITQDDRVQKGSGWYEGKFAKTQNIELEYKAVPEYGAPPTNFKP